VEGVNELRRFNRSYTQRIGAPAGSYLGTGRPLAPSRVLFEIRPHGSPVADLRHRLDLDSGYLSRLLRQLQREGLVTVGRDSGDGRQRVARLTPKGRREWRRLDERSEQMAQRLVEPLSGRQRADLASALATAERLLRAGTVTFDVVDPRSVAARSAMAQYFRELNQRFRSGFDPAQGAARDATSLRAPGGAFVVIRGDHTVIGCGGLQRLDQHTAEIKRMWIHPDWRGLGLGGRLLARLETISREGGYPQVVLDTNETLTEAISMYQRAGYRPIERYNDNPYAHHWFAKDL
jgi:DNA-binding MarR family transcriptional regulator/GNAT superfamily N-acetyltransferase